MSFDKMAREMLMPIYERLQSLERDAASMQKVVGQMALGEGPGFDKKELTTLQNLVGAERMKNGDSSQLHALHRKVDALLDRLERGL